MAVYKAYRLHFTTPVHFGDNRDDYGVSQATIQSDTMYAALTVCLAKLGHEIPADGDLGFVISSLFPYYQAKPDAQAVYFMPKPLRSKSYGIDNIEHRKKIKKVEWLDIPHFNRVLRGENLFERADTIANIKGHYLTEHDIDEDFIHSQVQDRVTITRTGTDDARPFSMDRVTFAGHSGLYFLAQGDTSAIDTAIELLQYEGIGTDRNVGNGMFVYSVEEIVIDVPDTANYQMALSMYIPTDKTELAAMLTGEAVAYDFTRRGGWVTTPPNNTKRKNYTYAMLPASIYGAYKEGQPKGAILDLSEGVPGVSHPIYRCGRSMFLPIVM